jgi:hypothetical protein
MALLELISWNRSVSVIASVDYFRKKTARGIFSSCIFFKKNEMKRYALNSTYIDSNKSISGLPFDVIHSFRNIACFQQYGR